MGRAPGKLALKFIENKQARKTTYLKRKGCLMKKAHELSVLCGIDTCAIVCDGSESNCLETWPPNHSEVERIINQYRFGSKKAKKTFGLFNFLENQKKKIDKQTAKVWFESLEAKYRVNSLTEEELQSLALTLDQNLKMAKKKLELLETSSSSRPTPLSVWQSDLPRLQDCREDFCLMQDDVVDLSTLHTHRDNAEASSSFNGVGNGLELVSMGPMPLSVWQFNLPPLQDYGEDLCLKLHDVIDRSTNHTYRDNAEASSFNSVSYGMELVSMDDYTSTPAPTLIWCNYECDPNDRYYDHDHGMDISKQAYNAIRDHHYMNGGYEMQPPEQFPASLHCADQSADHPLGVFQFGHLSENMA